MSTVGQLIEAAYRKCGGIIASGEEVPAHMMQDGLETLNTMLDAWSIESIMVYASLTQTFTWPAGESTQTIGPSGDLTGIRPVHLQKYSYTTLGTVKQQIIELVEESFLEQQRKMSSPGTPQYLHINPTMPDVEVSICPTPDTSMSLTLVSRAVLSLPETQEIISLPAELPIEFFTYNDLSSNLEFPPGYERALVYNLAIELCPELGMEAPPTVQRIAMASKRNLKRYNKTTKPLQTSIPGIKQHYNINRG